MLTYNTMRFGTDVFTVSDEDTPVIGSRQALLISSEALDASAATAVNNFIVTGTGGTGFKRRIMLKIDNKIYRFVDGALTEYSGSVTPENVLNDGNTPDDLLALADLSALVGKLIYPILALSSSTSANPSIKIGLNLYNGTVQKTKTVVSGRYYLPTPSGVVPKITAITSDITKTGSGSATITARIRKADGDWTEYAALNTYSNVDALAIQFKILYSVNTVGSDSVKVNSITVNYIADGAVVSGNAADLFSIIPDFETGLRLCYLVVRHKKLIDSTIEAYASFFPPPATRERIEIGTGTGSVATYTLGKNNVPDEQIDHSTIRIYVDGVQTSNFDFNTETSEVTLAATNGKSVLASYSYDCGLEEWQLMDTEFFQQPYRDGTYMTRFSYSLPDDIDASVANIRLRFGRPSGQISNQSLGKATGKTQQIVLPHVAQTDSIALNADFSYDFDSRILTFVAAQNTNLKLSYEYKGEQHKIYSWAAGWSAA